MGEEVVKKRLGYNLGKKKEKKKGEIVSKFKSSSLPYIFTKMLTLVYYNTI